MLILSLLDSRISRLDSIRNTHHKKNHTDLLSTEKIIRLQQPTMLKSEEKPMVKPCSSIWQMKNSKRHTLLSELTKTINTMPYSRLRITQPPQSIGDQKVQLHQSKIKDNVDHVGHSVQQVYLKDTTRSQLVPYQTSLNNNFLIAQLGLISTLDAMEVCQQEHLTMLREMVSQLKLPIHMYIKIINIFIDRSLRNLLN